MGNAHKKINHVETNHMWPLFSDSLLNARQCASHWETMKKPDMFCPHSAYNLVNKYMANFHMGNGKKSHDERTHSTMEPVRGAPTLSIPAKMWE